MLIDREHYFDLLRKTELLLDQNVALRRENQILALALEEQKCTNYQLQNKIVEMKEYLGEMNERLVNQNDSLHSDLKAHTTSLSQKQKEYLDQKFKELETSSFQKYKLFEMKNTASRLQNYQLHEFFEKVKKIYRNSNKSEKQPTSKDIIKWIKEIKPKKQNLEVSEQQSTIKLSETKTSWKKNSIK